MVKLSIHQTCQKLTFELKNREELYLQDSLCSQAKSLAQVKFSFTIENCLLTEADKIIFSVQKCVMIGYIAAFFKGAHSAPLNVSIRHAVLKHLLILKKGI